MKYFRLTSIPSNGNARVCVCVGTCVGEKEEEEEEKDRRRLTNITRLMKDLLVRIFLSSLILPRLAHVHRFDFA